MRKQYCKSCGKIYNEAEYLVGQCNDCDPFEDPDLMFELFGESNYLDELTTPDMTDEYIAYLRGEILDPRD